MNSEPKREQPTRSLVETSVGVRQAARNLSRSHLRWQRPNTILIITKPDVSLLTKLRLVLDRLMQEKNLDIYVEDSVIAQLHGCEEVKPYLDRVKAWNSNELRKQTFETNCTLSPAPSLIGGLSQSFNGPLRYTSSLRNSRAHANDAHFRHDLSDPDTVDLVITLGGDGTVLYAAWIFQKIVPPVLPFHLGSLGFLTTFDFSCYESVLERILYEPENTSSKRPMRLGLRMRLNCAVYRARTVQTPGLTVQNDPMDGQRGVVEPISTSIPDPDEVFQILNDLVVDRGPSPYISQLEVFGDGRHLTTVQADGLVLATPTGSTAYSLSAGGSLVHPEVPAILLTPICPHTLSFRPMLLPDSMELKIVIPSDSRNGAWVSFDGRHRVELYRGDTVIVTASCFPVPTLCHYDQTKDWFESLARCLRWNERAVERQKSFVWGLGVIETDN